MVSELYSHERDEVFVQVIKKARGNDAFHLDVFAVPHRGIQKTDEKAIRTPGVGEIGVLFGNGIEAFAVFSGGLHLRAENKIPRHAFGLGLSD